MTKKATVAVIGLGAYGSACSYQLQKLGAQVIGIDQYAPPHIHGSTHGDTRITRFAVFEGEQYVTTARRSVEIFASLQKHSDEKLFHQNGFISIGSEQETKMLVAHGKSDPLAATIEVAKKSGTPLEILDTSAIRKRFPAFNIPADTIGCYEAESGTLFPEACVKVQMELAHKLGVEFLLNTKVTHISESTMGVKIATDSAVVEADIAIITAGPWVQRFLPHKYHKNFDVQRQVLYWFEHSNPSAFSIQNSPNFIWYESTEKNCDAFYGFPAQHGSSQIKISREVDFGPISPDGPLLPVSTDEISSMFRHHAKGCITGLTEHCARAETCFYTVTPNSMFLMAPHPQLKNVFILSACSGHGFKHSAALGEVMAHHVLGKNIPNGIDMTTFDWPAIGQSTTTG